MTIKKKIVKGSAKGSPKGSSKGPAKRSKKKIAITSELKKISTGIVILVGLVIVFAMAVDFYMDRHEPKKAAQKKEVAVKRSVAPESIERKEEAVKKHNLKKTASVAPPVKRPLFEIFDDTGAIPERKPKPKPVVKDSLPRVAIIIDDIGFDKKIPLALMDLDRNITLSILPGAPHARAIAEALRRGGAEIMLHLPMEPMEYPKVDPGPGALLATMTPDELLDKLRRDLDAIPYVTGVNNHMGSRITSLAPQMNQIFTVLKQKKLFFIDSMTSKNSICRPSASLLQISFAQRDVFLDNIQETGYIKKQLEQLVEVAKQHGTAIAIGHPYKLTYSTLKSEMARLKSMVKIVPASSLAEI